MTRWLLADCSKAHIECNTDDKTKECNVSTDEKKTEDNLTSRQHRDLLGILFLAFGLLLAFALFAPASWTGWLGRSLMTVVRGLLGTLSILLPAFMFLFSLMFFRARELSVTTRQIGASAVLYVIATAFISLFSLPYETLRSILEPFAEKGIVGFRVIGILWEIGLHPELIRDGNKMSGGLLGGLLAHSLERISGTTGAVIILFATALTVLIYAFGLSPAKLAKRAAALKGKRRGVDPQDEYGEYVGEPAEHSRDGVFDADAIEENGKPFSDGEVADFACVTTNNDILRQEAPPGDFPRSRDRLHHDIQRGPIGWETFDQVSTEEVSVAHSSDGVAFPKPPPGYRSKHGRDRQREPLQGKPYLFDRPHTIDVQESEDYPVDVQEPDDQLMRDHEGRQLGVREPEDFRFVGQDSEDQPISTQKLSGRPIDDGLRPPALTRPPASDFAIRQKEESIQEESIIDRERWKDRADGKPRPKRTPSRKQMSILNGYKTPPLKLLEEDRGMKKSAQEIREIRELGRKLEETLESFGVEARIVNYTSGPTITRFELAPGPGIKVSRIVSLSDDIALSLAAMGVRIEAPIPGKSAIGIEIPNRHTRPVLLRSIIQSDEFKQAQGPLVAALGRDVGGDVILCDLARMPHILIAGATGSGKSVCINSILISLLYRSPPEDVRFLMIDPKIVELNVYNGIPHLMHPVVTDPEKAYGVLNFAVREMEKRYRMFADRKVRDIDSYNEAVRKITDPEEDELPLPRIVIVIDELADLMAVTQHQVEEAISRLMAKARAVGIHVIIATQRPSVDVITGVIKANIPSRIAFAVASQVDSRTIIDSGGAEKLLGKGDMLYFPIGSIKAIRGQGAFVSNNEVEAVLTFIKDYHDPQYDEGVALALENPSGVPDEEQGSLSGEDELLLDALTTVIEADYAAVSLLQRRLSVGYPRAARLIDRLCELGWVGPHEGSKPRKILITREQYEHIMREADGGGEEFHDF
ncbi:MAG TPA: DNA translocase FtsK [Clostridiaceae bacterium]|nr:DNA translocase FtsK [Clostridiaceae bacterium]